MEAEPQTMVVRPLGFDVRVPLKDPLVRVAKGLISRRAYPAIKEEEEYDDKDYQEEESYSYYPEAYPATGSHDEENDPDQDPDEDLDEDFEDDQIDESEATALNAMKVAMQSSLCWLPTLRSVKPVAKARAKARAKVRARAKSFALTVPWSRDATSCAL